MVAVTTVATLLIASAGSLFMAWTIGAGSSGSTPFPPAVGANAISIMRAGFFVGILGLLGAILQGANVSATIGGGLIRGVTLSPTAAIVGLFTAGLLVAVGVFTGYPIATAFTVTGAITGVGLALGGTPNWPVYRRIVTLWALIPFVGGGAAYATSRTFQSERYSTTVVVAALAGLTDAIIANMRFTVLGPPGESRSLARLVVQVDGVVLVRTLSASVVSACISLTVAFMLIRMHHAAPERTERRMLLALGGLVAFSAGGTQVGLAVGPLIPLVSAYRVPILALLVGGGIGLLIGSWTGALRMIKALSQDYSELGPKRSIACTRAVVRHRPDRGLPECPRIVQRDYCQCHHRERARGRPHACRLGKNPLHHPRVGRVALHRWPRRLRGDHGDDGDYAVSRSSHP